MKTILIILCILLFIFEFTLTFKSKNNYSYEIKWKGIIWVLLDRASILYYNSDDEPMKLVEYKKFKNE